MAVLERAQSVCTITPQRLGEVSPFVSFVSDDLHRSVKVTRRDWNEMGKPETVTLTVEPGDLLNG